jgi:hypothetical protein
MAFRFGKKTLDSKAKGKIFEAALEKAKVVNGSAPSLRALLGEAAKEAPDSAVVTDLVKEFGNLGLRDFKDAEPSSWWDGADGPARLKALQDTAVWLNS